jgi:hypothetical protein
MNVHWKKLTSENKGKPEQKFDAAFGTIFGIFKCFQRSKQKLRINFSCACTGTESTDFILKAFKKIFNW